MHYTVYVEVVLYPAVDAWLTKVEVVDPLTVRLHTATPYPVLANDMSTIYIASRKNGAGASTADYDSGKAMIGTGPYRFGSFKRGDRI